MKIGLIGDLNENVSAHKAIPVALKLAAQRLDITVEHQWIHSKEIEISQLKEFTALWCVPASPYEHTDNVLLAIKYAREKNVPFLGTCGGYQHAALEFVRNVLSHAEADNSETNPDASMPVISALVCKLYDVNGVVELEEKSIVALAYGKLKVTEEYFCGYGVNREYLHLFENTDLHFSGFDADGDPRALEIRKNRFFVGTAFQPERSAFNGVAHPLVCTYLKAAL